MSKKKKPKDEERRPPEPAPSYRPFSALKGIKLDTGGKGAEEAAARARSVRDKQAAIASTPGDEELALHRMMSGVTPLDSRARRIPRSASALPESRLADRRAEADDHGQAEADMVHAHLRALVEGGTFEVEDDGRRVEGRRPGVPQPLLRQLRRGLLPIDARLDLHGVRAEEAKALLSRFLGEKRSRGERCVLVIHGKGEHSPGRLGILRGEISAWLSQGEASVHVAAFSTATPGDGGEGAVYVLLTR